MATQETPLTKAQVDKIACDPPQVLEKLHELELANAEKYRNELAAEQAAARGGSQLGNAARNIGHAAGGLLSSLGMAELGNSTRAAGNLAGQAGTLKDTVSSVSSPARQRELQQDQQVAQANAQLYEKRIAECK